MSSAQAVAFHSITIGDKNTWDDWHLVPTSRPKFTMPPVKTSYVNIPGGDGIIDLTTALTGRPTYGNRQGSFEFLVLNDSLDGETNYGLWYERYSEIATYLHGKEFKAVLDDDPLYFYEGRFSVNEWKSEAHWSKIVIDYNVGPYKKTQYSAGELWLWDPFDLGDPDDPNDTGDSIYSYKNLLLNNSTLNITYIGDVFQDTPVFVCSAYNGNFDMSVTYFFPTADETKKSGKEYCYKNINGGYTIYEGSTFEEGVIYYESIKVILKVGTNVMTKFTFRTGENDLWFRGSSHAPGYGIVTIQNTGGRL